jgi:hypothetical protein
MSCMGPVDSTLQEIKKKVHYFHVYVYAILNLTSAIVLNRVYALPCDGASSKRRLSKNSRLYSTVSYKAPVDSTVKELMCNDYGSSDVKQYTTTAQ